MLLRSAFTDDVAGDHRPGGDTDTYLEAGSQTRGELMHGVYHRHRRAHRALGIVLMSLG